MLPVTSLHPTCIVLPYKVLPSVEPQSNCVQALGALPEVLVIRILIATPTPVHEQIRLLPSAFHTAAVHAAFPTIDADRSVCVRASDLEYAPFAKALWPALSLITSFRTCNRGIERHAMSSQAAAALGSQLDKLSCIQQLCLDGNRMCAKGAKALGPHLAHLMSLQQLRLGNNDIGPVGVQLLGPHLAHQTSIQQLDLSCNRMCANGAKALGRHLAYVTSIQQRHQLQ